MSHDPLSTDAARWRPDIGWAPLPYDGVYYQLPHPGYDAGRSTPNSLTGTGEPKLPPPEAIEELHC
jgi:hypothetical protein